MDKLKIQNEIEDPRRDHTLDELKVRREKWGRILGLRFFFKK
jgi:hypothetical protein